MNEDEDSLSCEVNPQMSSDNLEGVKKAIWRAEWQANALAPRVLMPRTMFLELFNQIYEEQSKSPYFQTGDVMERTLEWLGACFGVSKYAAKTRAIQLGIDMADGAYLFVDGEYYPPINYPIGTLGKNQTLPYLFEKGFTGGSGEGRKKATGMGLYLAQEIAKELNITLQAGSQWGKGFEMQMSFPVV